MAETIIVYKVNSNFLILNIDQIAMCYISMDSSRQALQTNGKLISKSFFELTVIF